MILITGGTGYVGKELLKSLNADDVKILARKGSLIPKNYEAVYGDLMDKDSLVKAVDKVDCVVHLAAVTHARNMSEFYKINVEGTKNLVEACKNSKVKRFIFISSMAVCRKYLDDYGKSKRDAEEIIKNSGLSYVILRPTMIYGGDSEVIKRFISYVKKIPFIIPMIGKGSGKIQPVHVNDVANVIAGAIDNEKALGKIYSLLGGTRISLSYFLDFLSSRLGINKIKVSIPESIVLFAVDFITFFNKNFPLKREFIKSFNYDVEGDNREAENDFQIRFKKLSQGFSL